MCEPTPTESAFLLPPPFCQSVGHALDMKLAGLEAAVDCLKKENAELVSKQRETEENLISLQKEVGNLYVEVGQKVAFSASLGGDEWVQFGPSCSEQTVVFTNVFFNMGNAYDACTGIFTAPCKGAFQFIFKTTGLCEFNSGAYLAKNGQRQVSTWRPLGNGRDTATQAVILELEAGDTVNLVNWASCDQLFDNQYHYSTFSGFMLFPLDEPKSCIDLRPKSCIDLRPKSCVDLRHVQQE